MPTEMIDQFHKDYKELQKLCKKAGCYCPPSNEVMSTWANCPFWLKFWYKIQDNHKLFDTKKAKVIKI